MEIVPKNWYFFALILLLGCKKGDSPNTHSSWNLVDYKVSYYNESDQKIYEEKPETLKQFDDFIISGNRLQFETTSQSKKTGDLLVKDDNSQKFPVSLVYFKGSAQVSAIKIEWGTATEKNNSHFEIFRSVDGLIFTIIAQINGTGTSNELHQYSYTDINPLSGTHYYKLISISYDGTATEYGIIAVNYIKKELYPLIIEDDKTYLPFAIENFEKVEVLMTTSREMIWEAKEENIRYVENGALKIAAYAKLEMKFAR